MIEQSKMPIDIGVDAAFAAVCRAIRTEVLRQARLGISVPEWKEGKVVWVSPAEVFARCSDSTPAIMEKMGS